MKAFDTFMRNLPFRKLLQPAAGEAVRSCDQASTRDAGAVDRLSGIQVLKIDLCGLRPHRFPRSSLPTNMRHLVIESTDHTKRLAPFLHTIQEYLTNAGYFNSSPENEKNYIEIVNAALEYYGQKGRTFNKVTGRRTYPIQLSDAGFDARGLIETCRDRVWAKDVVLEKLCVMKGFTRSRPDGGRAFKEPKIVCSFPLPQSQ